MRSEPAGPRKTRGRTPSPPCNQGRQAALVRNMRPPKISPSARTEPPVQGECGRPGLQAARPPPADCAGWPRCDRTVSPCTLGSCRGAMPGTTFGIEGRRLTLGGAGPCVARYRPATGRPNLCADPQCRHADAHLPQWARGGRRPVTRRLGTGLPPTSPCGRSPDTAKRPPAEASGRPVEWVSRALRGVTGRRRSSSCRRC
jgi:hypothetical protein